MQTYKNLNGNSGICRFELSAAAIRVCFSNAMTTYEYSYESAGAENVESMKKLAVAGRGLNTFINEHTKDLYVR